MNPHFWDKEVISEFECEAETICYCNYETFSKHFQNIFTLSPLRPGDSDSLTTGAGVIGKRIPNLLSHVLRQSPSKSRVGNMIRGIIY